MSGCKLIAIGTAVPQHIMTQAEAAELAADVGNMDERQRRSVAVLYRKTGVEKRHTFLPCDTARQLYKESLNQSDSGCGTVGEAVVTSAGPTTKQRMQWYAELAPPLAAESARNAIAAAGKLPSEITHLITVSCTGFSAPGVDIELIERLGLPSSTERVQVGFMGCHGALNGLRVAKAICESNPTAQVLLTAVELCGVHYHFEWGSERLIGNSLFADGSASVVLENDPTRTLGWDVVATGSCLIPNSKDAMSWNIGDLGYEMTLSARIPDLIRSDLRPWLVDWLGQQGESLESIANWVVHPGGPRVLDAVGESLELPHDALDFSREVLRDYGNMSSPTVLFILEKVRQAQRTGPALVLGFGPGLMAEVALLR